MLETAILLLLGVAVCVVCRVAYQWALRPDSAENTWAVICACGSGEGVEQRVRCLMGLRACGLLRCRVVLADGGLDAQGRKLALNLSRRWPELELWSDEML